METVKTFLEKLPRADESLEVLAKELRALAKAQNNESVSERIAEELAGYPTTATESCLREAGRAADSIGRLSLSVLDSALEQLTNRLKISGSESKEDRTFILARQLRLAEMRQERKEYMAKLAEQLVLNPGFVAARRCAWSIHGILTRGAWQKVLVPLLTENDVLPYPYDYRFYDPVRMLFERSRDKLVDGFRDEYGRFSEKYPGIVPSVIAHSMGSYILTRAIEKYDLRFDRVILCGSIVRQDYPWSHVIDKGLVSRVLNDSGRRDIWSRLAPWFIKDAGSSGYKGFDDLAGDKVRERINPWYRHSDYFHSQNFLKRWIPFIKGLDPADGRELPLPGSNWRVWTTRFLIAAILAALVWVFSGKI